MTIGSKDNKRALSAAEFESQLLQQMRYLERSCRDFDSGAHDEAPRIATTIRVLVHDTPQSTSLLTHLGFKNQLRYVDTGVYREAFDIALATEVAKKFPKNKIVAKSPRDVGLVETGQIGDGPIGWYAPLVLQRWRAGTPPYIATKGLSTFSEWWETPLVESSTQKSFSRAHLVKIMANQAGGAHVDAGLDADYADLCIDPQGALVISSKPMMLGDPIPDIENNIAFASVRQIAFELMLTLQRRNALREPGALARSDPFLNIKMPTLPHNPVGLSSPIIMSGD